MNGLGASKVVSSALKPHSNGAGNLPQIQAGENHKLEVYLKNTSLRDARQFKRLSSAVQYKPRLVLHIEEPVSGAVHRVDRVLVDLTDPMAGWSLMGDYTLMNDLGGYSANRLTSAYITKWINVFRTQQGGHYPKEIAERPSYNMVETVNSFRSLSSLPGKVIALPSPGLNLYLRRSRIDPSTDPVSRQQIFDVVVRGRRGYQVRDSDTWGLDTNLAMNIEIAGAIAEGYVLRGENGIDSVLKQSDSTIVIEPSGRRPKWLADPLTRLHLHSPRPGISIDRADHLLVSEKAPNWAWQIDTSWRHKFRALYAQKAIIAKGANIQSIAHQFEKIDKMYQIYEGSVGNLPGPYASTGAMLSAIASMKREENKLWCYSSVMMGYVSDAVGDDDAALNRDVKTTKATAAKLCHINGNPDDGKEFIRNAVTQAAHDGVKSWATNITKEGVGGVGADAHSAWGIGSAVSDAAAVYRSTGSNSTSVINREFHQALSNALHAQE